MKIFMVTKPISPLWNEGSKNLAFNLATHIKDHKFDLMTCKGVKLPKFSNIEYDYFYPSKALNTAEMSLFSKVKLFYKLLSKKDIDIYHFIFTHNVFSSWAISVFLKFSKKRSIQTLSTPLRDLKLKKCLFADKIVVLSEWTKKRVLSLGYKNVVKINPGIDLDKFSKNKTSSVRKKLDISEDDFVILFPNNYSIERGTRTILKILRRLIDNFPRTKVIFACRVRDKKDAKEKKFLMKVVKNMRLENKITFLDCVPYMPELINSSDIVVFPTLSQSLKMEIPMVLLESLALEKPVIISDVPPLNELLQEEKAGMKIQPGDSEDLFKSIALLIKNKNLRNKMGKTGRVLVEKEFNIKKVANDYRTVYKELETE